MCTRCSDTVALLHARYPSWTAIEDLPLGESESEEAEGALAGSDGILLDVCRELVSCGVLTQRD